MAWLTIAVGAEGVSETEGKPWIRPATEEERKAFIEERRGNSPEQFDLGSFLIDHNGRPYFLMSVDEENAPIYVVEKVKCHCRVVRVA
jgi:hypothetical protein